LCDEDQPDFGITYRKRGTSDGYRQKVYGGEPVPFVSFDNVQDGEVVPAWSLQKVYDKMWDGIAGKDGHSVNAMRVTPDELIRWVEHNLWDMIICTVPRHELCLAYNGLGGGRPHTFVSQSIYVGDEAMSTGMNEIVYNGDPEYSWYRSSNIGGYEGVEWGEDMKDVLTRMGRRTREVRKPIRHDCDCWTHGNIVFAGRYGEWRKGVLVHDAFVTAFKAVEELYK
jgi:hypothetical protein